MSALAILALKSTDWLVQPGGGGIWKESDSGEKQQQVMTIILFSMSLVLLLWLISRIQSRLAMPQASHRPWRVFRELLKHHGLSLSDRLLLAAVARSRRIKQPALLLLSPGLFSQHATQWLGDSRLAVLWPNAKGRLTRIAQHIFTEVPEQAELAR